MIKTVYKVVDRRPNGMGGVTYYSCRAGVEGVKRSYSTTRWTRPNKDFAAHGYGLTVFATLLDAHVFLARVGGEHYDALFEALAIDPYTPKELMVKAGVLKRAPQDGPWNTTPIISSSGYEISRTYSSWPPGTLMSNKVKLVQEINWTAQEIDWTRVVTQ